MTFNLGLLLGMATQALIAGVLGFAGIIRVSVGQQLTGGILNLTLFVVACALRWLFLH